MFFILPPQPGPSPTFAISMNSSIHIVAHTWQSSVIDWIIVLKRHSLPVVEGVHTIHPYHLPCDFAITSSRKGGAYFFASLMLTLAMLTLDSRHDMNINL